jgi:predicted transcriptional regulator
MFAPEDLDSSMDADEIHYNKVTDIVANMNDKILEADKSEKDYCEIFFTDLSDMVFDDVCSYVSSIYPGVKINHVKLQSNKGRSSLTLVNLDRLTLSASLRSSSRYKIDKQW